MPHAGKRKLYCIPAYRNGGLYESKIEIISCACTVRCRCCATDFLADQLLRLSHLLPSAAKANTDCSSTGTELHWNHLPGYVDIPSGHDDWIFDCHSARISHCSAAFPVSLCRPYGNAGADYPDGNADGNAGFCFKLLFGVSSMVRF